MLTLPFLQAAQHIVEFLVHFYDVFPEFVNHDVRSSCLRLSSFNTDIFSSTDLHRWRILRRSVNENGGAGTTNR
jgi:hypothetical protein